MNQQQQQQPGMPQPGAAGDQATGAQVTPQQTMMQQPQQPQQQLLQLPEVDAAQLDALKGEDRSNFVGNNIYGVIQSVFGDQQAPRLTGMLLDESAVNYKDLLTNSQYFTNKVHEAH